MIADRKAFIVEQTRVLPVPYTPEIALHLADEVTPLWQKTEDELGEMGLPPPFWAFAWAGGQALARYILDHPDTVGGRRVLDFASGSGLVAIAAMKAGATKAYAADIDGFALEAMALNAEMTKPLDEFLRFPSRFADHRPSSHEWMRGADFVVAVGSDDQHVPQVRVGDQALQQFQSRGVQPLQVVEE